MQYCGLVYNLNFVDRLSKQEGRSAGVGGESVYFERRMSGMLKDMLLSNFDHGLRLNSFPIDFSPETWRLRHVHVTVSDFGCVFDQAGKGRGDGSVCARGRPG